MITAATLGVIVQAQGVAKTARDLGLVDAAGQKAAAGLDVASKSAIKQAGLWQDAAGKWRNAAGQFATDAEKAAFAFRACLVRPPTEAEVARLVKLHDEAKAKFAKEPAKARPAALPTACPTRTYSATAIAAANGSSAAAAMRFANV